MQPGLGEVATDPVRLRESAGLVRARAGDVDDVAVRVREALTTAAAACGGPLTSAALAAFEQELARRSAECAEALDAAGLTLARMAADAEAADRFPAVPPLPGSITEALG